MESTRRLARGAPGAPLMRTMEAIEDVIPPGTLLPQHSYLGDRPPVLPDYLDDQVASTVRLPAVQKLVVIHGIELSPGA